MQTYLDNINHSLTELKRFLQGVDDLAVILSHVDADGLCAATILKRFLALDGIRPRHVFPAKGENAFTPGTAERLRQLNPSCLFVLDLGVMDEVIAPGVPTVFIDHHRPFGYPKDAIVLSSYGGQSATPTSLLIYDLLSRLSRLDDLSWLSAVGTAGDLGSDFVFAQEGQRYKKLKKKDVREAEVLINSAKRSSAYDIPAAIGLLDGADDLSYLVDHQVAGVRLLERYRSEVNREVKRCRHERPHFRWKVAIVPFKSCCEIQGLIAETWRRQLRNYLVIAANFGYIDGKVAYVIRTELDTSVIDFMESLRPAGYDGHVVFGHDRAAGAVLDKDIWLRLSDRMRFKNTG
jgi:single-stranded-DNA-specific exonuclease